MLVSTFFIVHLFFKEYFLFSIKLIKSEYFN